MSALDTLACFAVAFKASTRTSCCWAEKIGAALAGIARMRSATARTLSDVADLVAEGRLQAAGEIDRLGDDPASPPGRTAVSALHVHLGADVIGLRQHEYGRLGLPPER